MTVGSIESPVEKVRGHPTLRKECLVPESRIQDTLTFTFRLLDTFNPKTHRNCAVQQVITLLNHEHEAKKWSVVTVWPSTTTATYVENNIVYIFMKQLKHTKYLNMTLPLEPSGICPSCLV